MFELADTVDAVENEGDWTADGTGEVWWEIADEVKDGLLYVGYKSDVSSGKFW